VYVCTKLITGVDMKKKRRRVHADGVKNQE
jgi:hypothetical protein